MRRCALYGRRELDNPSTVVSKVRADTVHHDVRNTEEKRVLL
jgi:hypothetical protein